MMRTDMNKVDVAVYDEVREYFRVDKRLGGLIKIFVSERIEVSGRHVGIYIPNLKQEDEIHINGMKYEQASNLSEEK